jgi:hypothetical protein
MLLKKLMYACVVTMLALVGCGGDGNGNPSDNGGNNDNNNDVVDKYRTWPSNEDLANWRVSGMPAPAGASNIRWGTSNGLWEGDLVINFDCTSTTDGSVNSWFTSNGWVRTYNYEGQYEQTDMRYTKTGCSGGEARYLRVTNCQINVPYRLTCS